MLAYMEEGVDMPYEAVMDRVKTKFTGSIKNFVSKADREKLLELLGDDLIDELVGVRAKKGRPAGKQALQSDSPQKTNSNYVTEDDLAERVRKWRDAK
jgi:hypothetical protein